ncbi:hypothetical protein JHK82_040160 [Glycine max]|nr:hypothetical protein JHK82_040160 [Glycine max]KAG5122228.1 hypothetical protein JHK84_040568 [Glycine max]
MVPCIWGSEINSNFQKLHFFPNNMVLISFRRAINATKSLYSGSFGANVEHEATEDGKYDGSHREDESETLSDIHDEEVDLYIHDEEGKHIKKILWETTNREYLEDLTQVYFLKEQAAKEAAAVANKKAFEEKFENCSEDILAARELVASSTEAVAKSRKVLSKSCEVLRVKLDHK